ncbi:lipopolysaccharide biosynthesis protein [Carboxylicivirga sp. A043]|uniref:glycosyl transferase family 90 n=1 Tax=Carboxylicivirga litoralis TaxID=2816963 RepID=UPI0021CB5C8E|nr:glycosyl transferase family 90 [Carboxylicivirga sp. A043]MCU4156462.1 lipopolysaccharide biosynthesis protein [Carboxylicivirga sp. A043]
MVTKIISKWYSFKYKNFKPLFYLKNYLRFWLPTSINQLFLTRKLQKIKQYDEQYINFRVSYYNQLRKVFYTTNQSLHLSTIKPGKKHTTYIFDTRKYTRYFKQSNLINYSFGDVTWVPDTPAIVKSRPVYGNNTNSVLLKLNQVRHFNFLNDKTPFEKKLNKVLFRAYVLPSQPQRIHFLEKFNNNPLFNIGHVNSFANRQQWQVPKMNLFDQLQYKFIMSIEGVDVATNLKWIMSSNSVAVMPTPKYETWFMEGCLLPDFHYIHVQDDYSDLEEKIQYYIENPEEAKAIVKNANNYVAQFKNKEREDLISLLVLQKYFSLQVQPDETTVQNTIAAGQTNSIPAFNHI